MKYALLIGINYKNSPYSLNGCIQDIETMENFIRMHCNYTNITKLIEENATKINIINNLTQMLTKIKEKDICLIYYAGHGSRQKDMNGDEHDGFDETILPYDYLSNGIITDDWLYQYFICKFPINAKLIIFTDCCHSGSILDLPYKFHMECKPLVSKPNINYISNEWKETIQSKEEFKTKLSGNILFFSGCMDEEQSREIILSKTLSSGVFTYCLHQILKRYVVKNQFNNNSLSVYQLLKEINCKFQMLGFTQSCCYSSNIPNSLHSFFEL